MATASKAIEITRRYETGRLRCVENLDDQQLYVNCVYDQFAAAEDWTGEQLDQLHDEDPVYYHFEAYKDTEGWYCVWASGPTPELAREYQKEARITFGRDWLSLQARWMEYRNPSLLDAIEHCVRQAELSPRLK